MPVVVITGGTAGVGRATAEYFALRGYDVGVIARSPAGLQATVTALQTHGARAIGMSADVADRHQLQSAAEHIAAALGTPDVWVNCAMCTVLAPFNDTSDEEFRRVTDVTYLGYVHGTRQALRMMAARDRGVIIQVGSALAYRSIPLQAAYCGAKAAIRGFTDALRCELIHQRSAIQLTMVQLPGMNTPQFEWARNKLGKKARPVAPVFQPEMAARAIYRASQRRVREVWLGSSSIQSIAGNMLFPALFDRLLAKKAWSGQTEEQPPSATADYLDAPVDGLHHARGRFSDEAKTHTLSASADLPGKVVVTLLGLLALRRFMRRR